MIEKVEYTNWSDICLSEQTHMINKDKEMSPCSGRESLDMKNYYIFDNNFETLSSFTTFIIYLEMKYKCIEMKYSPCF